MKIRPPAVTIGPPRFTDPAAAAMFDGAPGDSPSGTCHFSWPVAALTAASVPHGGGLHGSLLGENSNKRDMPKGAPRWELISAPKRLAALSAVRLSDGISRMIAGMLFVGTINNPWSRSHAIPPQCIPPTFPG